MQCKHDRHCRFRPIHVLSAPSKVENEELAQEMTPIGRCVTSSWGELSLSRVKKNTSFRLPEPAGASARLNLSLSSLSSTMLNEADVRVSTCLTWVAATVTARLSFSRDRGESSGFTHPHGSEAASGGGGRGAGGSSLLRRGERRLTRIAMAIVWLFLVCHMWKIIPTIFEAVYGTSVGWPAWLWKVKDLSHTLIVLNSAVNFLLYKLL